jgi:hypothetical protein
MNGHFSIPVSIWINIFASFPPLLTYPDYTILRHKNITASSQNPKNNTSFKLLVGRADSPECAMLVLCGNKAHTHCPALDIQISQNKITQPSQHGCVFEK